MASAASLILQVAHPASPVSDVVGIDGDLITLVVSYNLRLEFLLQSLSITRSSYELDHHLICLEHFRVTPMRPPGVDAFFEVNYKIFTRFCGLKSIHRSMSFHMILEILIPLHTHHVNLQIGLLSSMLCQVRRLNLFEFHNSRQLEISKLVLPKYCDPILNGVSEERAMR